MPRYAVLTHGIVHNVIMADSAEAAEELTGMVAVASDAATIGELYVEEDGTFIPVPEPVVIEHPPVEGAPDEAAADAEPETPADPIAE